MNTNTQANNIRRRLYAPTVKSVHNISHSDLCIRNNDGKCSCSCSSLEQAVAISVNLANQDSTNLAAGIRADMSRLLGRNLGVKAEEAGNIRYGPDRIESTCCSPVMGRRTTVTGTIYLLISTFSGKDMDKVLAARTSMSHDADVARAKLTALNLGISVNSRTVRVSISKYVPHAGKKELAKAARRATQKQGAPTDGESNSPQDIQPVSRDKTTTD